MAPQSLRSRARHANTWLLAASITLAAGLASSLASAQTSDVDALLVHGVQLRQAGDDDAALVEFRRAYDISHSPRARAQMALAEQALGRWADAEAHMTEALATTTDPWITRNADVLRGALATVAHHLGSLDARVNVQNGELWANGERVAALPLTHPVRISTGSVEIEIRAAGFVTTRRTVEIASGATSRERFNLVPVSEAANTAPVMVQTVPAAERTPTDTHATVAPPSTSSQGAPIGPIVVFGLGGVALVGSVFALVLRQQAIGNCTQSGDTLYCPTQSDADRASHGGTYTTAGDVLLVGGVAVVAIGAAWLAFELTRKHGESRPPRATIHALPMANGFHVGIEGSF